MDKIAIIGRSCLFPEADTPEKFWQNLIDEKDSTSLATAAEIGVDPYIFYDPAKGQADKYYSMRGGYIRDFSFDPTGYKLSPDFLTGLDSTFKWSLYVAKHALQDSGYLDQETVLADCGVILGNLSFPTRGSQRLVAPIYNQTLESGLSTLLKRPLSLPLLPDREGSSPYNAMIAGYPAAVIARALSLSGGSFALDAACASSLYAVKLACQSLLSGQTNLMLAGAVSCADPFFINMGFSIFQAYPDNGVSRPLDRATKGLIAGEGAGMFVLKRFDDAVRDGDKIYATIRGVGLSNDGRGKFLLSPQSKGQLLAFKRAYAEAKLDPTTIAYVECHATGTLLGDQTELATMDSFFGEYGATPLVGSVKSNFGHLLTAAGMASMLKVMMSMSKGVIPATINVTEPVSSPNDVISANQIVNATTPWPASQPLKRAAVSAFGFGGTNAHLIFEEGENPWRNDSDNENENGASGYRLAEQRPPYSKGQPSSKFAVETMVKSENSSSQPRLAITGMDAFFGGCGNLEAYGRSIYEGRQHFVPVPAHRWKGIENQSRLLAKYGFSSKAPAGAYIEDFELDFLRFGIPPNDVDQPIPQHLLILKVADNALQDAGLQAGRNVAVIVAMGAELALHQFRGRGDLSWQLNQALAQSGIALAPAELAELEQLAKNSMHNAALVNQYTSFIGNVMASRISARWDFSGPALTISAEENSSFKAVQLAQSLLATGEVEAVLVGAVDLAGSLENILVRQQMAPVNSGQATFSFDQQAAGWLPGEGAGAVVLRRHDEAQRDQDPVYAVVEAISLIHEPAPQSGTAPSPPSAETIQRTCLDALAKAAVKASDIHYVEAFGSGIPAEDEAEMAGLLAAYQTAEAGQLQCALGSVKANIGHTFAASGMASLIKTALCLHQQYIPAVPGWSAPKSAEAWQHSPFYVPTESRPWILNGSEAKRLAAINGLGADGASAHLILSEANRPKPRFSASVSHEPPYLLPIAAESQAGLQAQLNKLQQQLEQSDSLLMLAQECWQSYQRQIDARYTLSLVGNSKNQLSQEIQLAGQGIPSSFAQSQSWKTPQGSCFTPNPLGPDGKIAFVYPGAFNSYPGIGQDLLHLFPQLLDSLTGQIPDLEPIISPQLLYPRSLTRLTEQQLKGVAIELGGDPAAMLGSGVYFSWLFTRIVREYFGLQPHAAFGYSMGESAMMYALNVWPERDNNHAQFRSSSLFRERLSGPKNAVRDYWGLPRHAGHEPGRIWSLFILKTSPARVKALLQSEQRAFLTLINSPGEVVIAGDPAACRRVIDSLQCDYIQSPFNDAVLHCDPVKSEFDQFLSLHTLPTQRSAKLDFYFAADDRPASSLTSELIARNITTGVCQQLDFPRLIERVYNDDVRIFIELGVRSTCSRWIRETLADKAHLALAINHRSKDDRSNLIHMLAQLVSHRVKVDLAPLYGKTGVDVQQPKSFIKSVRLGGPGIIDTILAPENREKFADHSASPEPSAKPLPAKAAQARSETNLNVQHAAVSDPTGLAEMEIAPLAKPPAQIVQATLPPQKADRNGNPSSVRPDKPTFITSDTTLPRLTANPARLGKALTEQAIQVTHNHRTMLKLRQASLEQLGRLTQLQMATSRQLLQHEAAVPVEAPTATAELAVTPAAASQIDKKADGPVLAKELQSFSAVAAYSHPEKVIWDEAALLEFAGGDIANVFGADYAIIDSYSRRVRLPLPPYLLVSRVTGLEGKLGCYEPSFMQTEYDIPLNAWYAVDGQVPTAVAIESGQCDLLLISYLGIDFENKGHLVYRLLDCTLTFLDELPMEGQTLRYDISINSFARSGDNLLFFFSYNCFVGDKMVLKMRGGCAGFFSDDDLDKGKGIIVTDRELAELAQIKKRSFTPLLICRQAAFEQSDLLNLNDPSRCFGPQYDQRGLNPSLRYPDPAMLMIDRVKLIDPEDGHWGLGLIVAEKDLAPDHWYFPCHFKEDEVLAGSLMAEGCVQLLQFFMLYIGLQSRTRDARFQPVPDLKQVVRCRGQVTPKDSRLTYRMEMTDIGLEPRPYVIANVEIILDGKIIVDFKDLGLQLVEKSALPSEIASPSIPAALFTEYHITEFALGSISNCFGPDYDIYQNRRTPRTPNGELQLISRIMEIEAEQFQFENSPTLVSEYDVPAAPWYCRQNSYPVAPYSILMEIALQPCGFLSAYLGSTLQFPEEDFYFRNLDGDGRLLRDVDIRGKTVRNQVRLLSSTSIQGIIIQKFAFQLACDNEPFYQGEAAFGYFTAQALEGQVGLDGGQDVPPWLSADQAALTIDLREPGQRQAFYPHRPDKPHYRLAEHQLHLLDQCQLVAGGGNYGQGYIYGSRAVDPQAWFFTRHFYQDPVMPGSLGVEAILEAMQVFALQQDLGARFRSPHFRQASEHQIVWKYRGQIISSNKHYALEVHIASIDANNERVIVIADASLWKAGMRIYELKQVALRIEDTPQ